MNDEWIEKSCRLPAQHPHKRVKIWRGSPEKGREVGIASALDVARDPEIEAWRDIVYTDPMILSEDAASSPFFSWLDRAFAAAGADRITVRFKRRKPGDRAPSYDIDGVEFWTGAEKLGPSFKRIGLALKLRATSGYAFGTFILPEGWNQQPPINYETFVFWATRSGNYAIHDLLYVHPVYRMAPSGHQDLEWAADFRL